MIFGEHDGNTLEQFHAVKQNAEAAALMADGHLGYIMPVGGVAAYEDRVSVAGVGFDIACGNVAMKANLRWEEIEPYREEIADTIFSEISFGVGGTNDSRYKPTEGHPLFLDDRWEMIPSRHRQGLREKAVAQIGSVGSGNHYVDVMEDVETGHVWVGCHFGSRGFGHAVASNFLAMAQGEPWGARVPETETLLHLANPIGHDYWHLMRLAGDYAYLGREWVVRYVTQKILGGARLDLVHNNHNFAWREEHEGRELIVVRKGATPAFPGQRGFVGGSMGDDAVILQGTEGLEGEEAHLQRQALFSTVHGAGRVMSRTEARGKWKEIRQVREGRVSPEAMKAWIEDRDVTLRGGGLDEAPQAYRRLPDVLSAHGSTVEVLHTLRPRIVCMAGAGR